MSNSLVRKALDLFKDDLEDDTIKSDVKKKVKKQSDPMKRISTNKKGVKKQLHQLHHRQTNSSAGKKKKVKSAFDEYRKRQTGDHTDGNLQCLKLLSQVKRPSSSIVNSIIDQHKGKLAKNRKTEEPKAEEASVFSDRDFDEFEKEYFGN